MRRVVACLIDIASGLLFVVIVLFGARVLLQSRPLVYLLFPLVCTIAITVGWWRGRARALPLPIVAVLTSVPLLLVALHFYSGRNKPFMVFPVVTAFFVIVGGVLARIQANPLAIAAVVIVSNAAAALAGPLFVNQVVAGHVVSEKPLEFTIHLVDGRTISSADLRGRVVVLDFWATWCIPCRHELPVVQRVWDQMKQRHDVAVFAIDGVMTDSPTDPGDTPERAAEYFRRYGYTIPLAWDRGAVLEKSFALSGFPSLLVLDRDGRLRMRHTGYLGSEDLEKNLLEKIEEIRAEVSGRS